MTAAEAVAQAESATAYRNAERSMRRQARWFLQCNDQEEVEKTLRLAHHVGVEMVRNLRGSARDEWEKDTDRDDDRVRV